MQLIQIFLPLADNQGKRFPRSLFEEVEREFAARFEGFTAYSRAPASGLWVSPSEDVKRDDIVVYEVMCESVDVAWWTIHRAQLEARFQQESIVIRATPIDLL